MSQRLDQTGVKRNVVLVSQHLKFDKHRLDWDTNVTTSGPDKCQEERGPGVVTLINSTELVLGYQCHNV